MDVKNQKITKRFALYNGDCCKVLPELKDESIGFSIFSPPFSSLYSYSDSDADMSNAANYRVFFKHFCFLIEQLERVMKPGRVVAVHCMDLPVLKQESGEIGLRDFPGDIIKAFRKYGFIYHSRHCIWKDSLLAAVRTHAIGLAHKQIVKDSAMCRMGIPDYILAFRKPGENPKPIENEGGLTKYYGSRTIPRELERFVGHKEQGTNKRSHWIWQQYASPVWFDIRQTRVLSYREGKDKDDEKHIAPLQLDTIERCIALWSREGDVVLDPFAGIGSTGWVALRSRRRVILIELKSSYYRQMLRNIESLRITK
ncbi:MAG TPA: site-specific DNA-methyltransferase [bacterium]|nr:site-specific DNA-methyltransferase [bacterium]